AMGHVADGDSDGAWQDLLACRRLGRLVASRGSLIESLVGIAIDQIGANAQVTFLGHGKHSSKQIMAWLDDLRKLPPIAPLADKLDLCERFMALDTLQSVAAGGTEELDKLAGLGSGTPPANSFGKRV